MVLTNLNITSILHSDNSKSNLPRLKTKQDESCSIPLNILTIKMTTKQTLTFIFSGSIGLITNDIQKNIKKSTTLGNNQFI